MERLYVEQIKQYCENKLNRELKVMQGIVEYEWLKCIKHSLLIVDPEVELAIADVPLGDSEFLFRLYDRDGKLYNRCETLFLWSVEYEEDEKGYYVSIEGARNGVVCLNGLTEDFEYSIPEYAIEEMLRY